MFYGQRQNLFFVLNLCSLGLFVLNLILPVQSPSWRCNDAFVVLFWFDDSSYTCISIVIL